MPPHRRAGEPGALWNNARESLSHAWSVIIIYVVLLAMICVLGVIGPNFLSPALIGNLFSTALPLVFAAIAQTVIVLIKGIDLSVGSIISLVMCVAASLMQDSALSIVSVFLLCLAIGVAAEVINGLFVVYARLQSIIVTLATSLIFGGVALYVMPQPGGYVPESLLTMLSGSVGPIPNSAIILIAMPRRHLAARQQIPLRDRLVRRGRQRNGRILLRRERQPGQDQRLRRCGRIRRPRGLSFSPWRRSPATRRWGALHAELDRRERAWRSRVFPAA